MSRPNFTKIAYKTPGKPVEDTAVPQPTIDKLRQKMGGIGVHLWANSYFPYCLKNTEGSHT